MIKGDVGVERGRSTICKGVGSSMEGKEPSILEASMSFFAPLLTKGASLVSTSNDNRSSASLAAFWILALEEEGMRIKLIKISPKEIWFEEWMVACVWVCVWLGGWEKRFLLEGETGLLIWVLWGCFVWGISYANSDADECFVYFFSFNMVAKGESGLTFRLADNPTL